LANNAQKKEKKGFNIHLEGRKISGGREIFSGNFRGRQPKNFENPWVKELSIFKGVSDLFERRKLY
jgi:hypothetical protein